MGWLDKVKEGVARTAGDVEDMATIGKLRLEIRTLHGKMQDTLQAIGARTYSLYEGGATFSTDILALCQDTDKVAAEIKAKEAEIAKIKT